LGTAIELLAAIPSIVYGMWGLLVFSPVLATYVQQPLQAIFKGVPYWGLLFRSSGRYRDFVGWHYFGHHDHSLYCSSDA
jgi:ABC-type phosphate transport system permease subunit